MKRLALIPVLLFLVATGSAFNRVVVIEEAYSET